MEYSCLLDAMLTKDIKAYEVALRNALLVAEPSGLAAAFIEYYSNYALVGQVSTIASISDALTTLTTSTRKQKDAQLRACMALGKLIMDGQQCVHPKRIEYNTLYCDVDASEVELILNNNVDAALRYPVLDDLHNSEKITYDMYRLLSILMNNIECGGKTTLIKLIQYLLICFTKPMPCEPTFFAELFQTKMSVALKRDVVWMPWFVLFQYVKTKKARHPEYEEFVMMHFKIFTHGYTKKMRNDRTNILLYCFLVLSSSKVSKHVVPRALRTDGSAGAAADPLDASTAYLRFYTSADRRVIDEVERDRRAHKETAGHAGCKRIVA